MGETDAVWTPGAGGASVGAVATPAFDEAYAELWRPMLRLAASMVDDPVVAEDVTQEAFARTMLRWAQLDDPVLYLRRAIVNRSRSELRKRAVRRRAVRAPVVVPPGEPVVDDAVLRGAAWPVAQAPRRRGAAVLRRPHRTRHRPGARRADRHREVDPAHRARAAAQGAGAMTDLETRISTTLQAVAHTVDGFAVPPASRLAARADRVRRAQRVRVGGATLVVAAGLVAGGLALAATRDDRIPPIGDDSTTTSQATTAVTSAAPTTTTPIPSTTRQDGGPVGSAAAQDPAFAEADRWVPSAADRVATLPSRRGYQATTYGAQPPGEGVSELYLGGVGAGGVRRMVMVTADREVSGGYLGCTGGAAGNGPDGVVFASRCLARRPVNASGVGVDAATLDRLFASVTDDAPTRLDTTGTDLVSVGQGPSSPRYVAISYAHPTRPGLQLTTTAEDRYDMIAITREVPGLRDRVDVDVNGAPGLQFVTGPERPDGPERTALMWQPEPGLVATIFVEGPSDELPAIARDVVVRPGDQVHRELDPLLNPPPSPPATTTTTTAPGGVPVVGLASIGILPAGEGWSAIEYQVIPASDSATETQQYVGSVRPDGDRAFVSVQAGPFDPQQQGCAPGAGTVGEMRLGSEGMVVGSRCLGDTMVTVGARLVDRATLERLLATVTADAPTRLDTTGTDLTPVGPPPPVVGAVRVRYAHPDGGPGAMVLTSPDDGTTDPLASLRRSLSPKDWDDVDIDGTPAVLYRSIVEGNVAWTNLVWRPVPGVLVTIMVSGPSDRLPTLARQVELPPAAAAHRELRNLPPNA